MIYEAAYQNYGKAKQPGSGLTGNQFSSCYFYVIERLIEAKQLSYPCRESCDNKNKWNKQYYPYHGSQKFITKLNSVCD